MYVCAWCQTGLDLPPGNLRGEPTEKHGMCWSCLLERLARLTRETPDRSSSSLAT